MEGPCVGPQSLAVSLQSLKLKTVDPETVRIVDEVLLVFGGELLPVSFPYS